MVVLIESALSSGSCVAAQRLYASLGFRLVNPYRATEFGTTFFYELDLAAPASGEPAATLRG